MLPNESEIGNLAGLQLQLELIGNQRNKFGIRRLALRIADSIPKKSLQSIQITSVPSDFDGVADSLLDARQCGRECFDQLRTLGIEFMLLTAPAGAVRSMVEYEEIKRFSETADNL